jgi:pilus assembly protein CpaB
MNRTVLFAGIGALGTALLVAMLLNAMMGGKKESAVPDTEVLVAARDLPIGAELTTSNTRWQKWPGSPVSGSLVQGVTKDEEWQKQKIRRGLTEGEPVTQGALLKDDKGSLLAARLEKNMRAVSIDVKAASGVSGFLSPDDRVDVMLTYTMRVSSNSNENTLQEMVMEKGAETILENVRVLATDQDAEGSVAGEGKAKVSKTITLEVTKEGAEKLALATQMGEIHLALRQMGDTSVEATPHKPVTDVTMGRIMGNVVEKRNEMESSGNAVRVYSGNSVQEVPVRGMRKETVTP